MLTSASEYGLGTFLVQNSQPITSIKICYANVEQECLSVFFGSEKFHTYI